MNRYKVNVSTEIVRHDKCDDALCDALLELAKSAASKAYAPYSKFRVGSAALLSNGEMISGSNQENAAYPSGLCAERVTIFYANARFPEEAVTHLMIYAETDNGAVSKPITPCGACRQVLIEKEIQQKQPMQIILVGASDMYFIESALSLMPLSFVPDSLNG
jgi:cytidine deaminase